MWIICDRKVRVEMDAVLLTVALLMFVQQTLETLLLVSQVGTNITDFEPGLSFFKQFLFI